LRYGVRGWGREVGFVNGIEGQNYGGGGEDLEVKWRGGIERCDCGVGLRDEIEE
jgi:hypothetical protein